MLYRAVYIAAGEPRCFTFERHRRDLFDNVEEAAVQFAEQFVAALRRDGWRDARLTHVVFVDKRPARR